MKGALKGRTVLLSNEAERIEKGEPVALAAIASAWAEKRIRALLASFIQVESLAQSLARRLRVDIQNGKLNVYDTFLKRERTYEAGDQSDLEKGHVWLIPRTVDAWLDANNLRPILATPSITPPVEWKAQSPYGVVRADDTDAGRLVRFADLVQWLMTTKEIPCRAAVELVCSVLCQYPGEAGNVLYLLSESDYAQPLSPGHSFAWESTTSFWDSAPPVSDTDKGVLGAVKYMRQYWGESPAPGAGKYLGQEVLDPLAIRMEVAHWVWGYGSRLKRVPKKQFDEDDVAIQRMPDGSTVIFPLRPGVVIYEPSHVKLAQRHTGVCDLVWSEAQPYVGDISPEEFRAGWPKAMDPLRLGSLQFSREGIARDDFVSMNSAGDKAYWVYQALMGLCQRGSVKCEPIRRIVRDGNTGKVDMQWDDFLIRPQQFLDWLTQQKQEPSRFIVAWCEANGVRPVTNENHAKPESSLPHQPGATLATSKRRSRGDLLTPVIRSALQQAKDPESASEVFVILRARAGSSGCPIVGSTDDGLKWIDANDEPQFLTLKKLRDRLRRMANQRA